MKKISKKETKEIKETKEQTTAEERAFKKRRLKRRILSSAFTALVIMAIIALNVVVGIISDKQNTSADLTDGSIYTLSDESREYLQNTLSSDVTITVLCSETEFSAQDMSYKQADEILKNMARESPHITLSYLDLNSSPNFAAEFAGETLAENYIVAQCEKTGRYKIIPPYDYFVFNQSYLEYYGAYVVEGSVIEQETISALMYITNETPVKVAFAEGYGESDSTALKNLLQKNGYDVETLSLVTTSEIPEDTDYVVLFAPSADIDKTQLEKLDKFLETGGKNVVYFATTIQPKTPNIDEFLNRWGISVGYDVIGQTDTSVLTSSDTLFAHLQEICDTKYTQTVYGSQMYTFGAHMRPVYTSDEKDGAVTTVLMKTFDKAYLYPLDSALAEDFDIEKADSGVFNDAVIAERGYGGEKSRVCVFGSEMFASNLYLSYTNSNNAEFLVGMWNYISGRQQGITIKQKSFMPAVFEINVKTANVLSILLCIVIPTGVIALGIIVWVRRRHR